MRTVLISGAGVAGATLAYWLDRRGLQPTVVEQDQAVRSSGNPVDVRVAVLPIAREMGILPALRDRATVATKLVIIGREGRPIARLRGPNSGGQKKGDRSEVEIARADLAAVLLEACRDLDIRFDDSIAELTQDPDGVDVRFRSGREQRFDLVIGADGVHSATRRMIFGSEDQFVRRLGMFVGTTTVGVDTDPVDNTAVQLYNAPGRLTAIHPGRGVQRVAFIFRRSPDLPFDHRDAAQHRQIICDHYATDGWLVPDLLELVRETDDLYFDAVSRIDLPRWSEGRVALVGDAASSISLLGDGSAKAILGAHTLAEELADSNDHRAAFRRYQSRHAPLISSARQVRIGASMLVPATGPGLAVRNQLARMAGMFVSSP
ncbi:FAD-dependent monooxygenase [Microlunatus soli]|uniref:2-polyprenyl-6-methoxyphenol hydroxylase n=1 Tax=Microlunatus soli TaxID=630515 RepID=A0A1H1PT35_9ACTN|nr:FAD-dependent monooxygenase [Microlunatus soli]SDS14432.1 2-polyprenyl-6-methoxyphenol hydroxylase [Microlunatus soli]